MTIAVLLPVRNGEADLPEWFEGVRPWADVVLALDDGSTDATRDVLEAEPLVDVLLANPSRPTSAGWDDGGNRRRLLAAANGAEPSWIVWLDADERLAPDDGAALAAFLRTDGLPGIAYGLTHCRMWGPDAYDPAIRWVYRVHAWRPGLHLPGGRLHEPPVPVEIPRPAWVRTTIRLQHLGGVDPGRVEVTRMDLSGDQSEDAPPADCRTRARITHSPRTEGRNVAAAAVTPARQSTNRSVPGRRRWTSNTSPVGARTAAQRTVAGEPAGISR